MKGLFQVRFLVMILLVLACLSGCQQQKTEYKSEKNISYSFVDTTREALSEVQLSVVGLPEETTNIQEQEVISGESLKAAKIEEILRKKREIYVKVTAYCPCATCCGWTLNRYGNPVYNYGSQRGRHKKVGYTSTGEKADVGTIAADIGVIDYGTKIYIPGYGFGVVKDTGGRVRGNHIDLFFHSHQDAVDWGVKHLKVAVWDSEQ